MPDSKELNGSLSSVINPVDTYKPPSRPAASTHLQSSYLVELLRTLRLQIINRALALHAPNEQRKVAIHKSRLIAVFHTLVHLVPLAGAITLLVLNFSKYFIGPDFAYSAALQFAAKLHEILMQASLTEVLLCIIRTQAMNDYIPLGAFSAILQNYQISYLWSLEFFSAIKAFSGRAKITFVLTIPILVALVAVVGPSSAALMVPRPNIQGIVGSGVLHTLAYGEGIPSRLNSTIMHDTYWNFSSANMEAATTTCRRHNENVGPSSQSLLVDYDWGIQRVLRFITTSRSSWEPARPIQFSVIATIPVWRSSVDFADFFANTPLGSMSNVTWSAQLPHPVVITRCTGPQYDYANQLTYIRDDGIERPPLKKTFKDLAESQLGPDRIKTVHIDKAPPLWVSSPEIGSSSLIAIIPSSRMEVNGTSNSTDGNLISQAYTLSELFTGGCQDERRDCLEAHVCTISAFWSSSDIEASYDTSERIVTTRVIPLADVDFHDPNLQYRSPITLDLREVPHLNSPDFSRSIRECMEHSLAYALAVTIADAVHGVLTEDENGDVSKLQALAKQYGFGYKLSSGSVQLALTVMIAYCIIIISYLFYIFITGSTSTAWDSTMEFVLLGLQSKRPSHLGYTSVGVNSLKTYEEPVGIRVNDGDEIELVFAHDRDTGNRNLKKIVPNRAY